MGLLTPHLEDLELGARRSATIGATAVVVVMLLALSVEIADSIVSPRPPEGYLAPALALAGVAIGVARPAWGLGLVVAAPVVSSLVGSEPTALWNVAVFAAFVLTWRSMRGLLVGAVVAVGNFSSVALFDRGDGFDPLSASIASVAGLLAAAVGSSMRAQRRLRAELEGRAADAIASRHEAVEHSVAEERLRIARDLHDGVGHQIAVISMHLGAVEVHLSDADSHVRAQLEAARGGVKQVLLETQQILSVLREQSEGADLGAVASHAAIPQLIEAARRAGQDVDATVTGIDLDLSGASSAAAYRLTQEMLTNAHRHGAGPVTLTIMPVADTLLIECSNAIAPHRADYLPGGGRGLVGLRERASSAGGTLIISAVDGTFRVRAELPTVRRTP